MPGTALVGAVGCPGDNTAKTLALDGAGMEWSQMQTSKCCMNVRRNFMKKPKQEGGPSRK